jgi:RHS repeat-associated protein
MAAGVDQLLADEQLYAATGGGYNLAKAGKVNWALTDQLGTVRDLAQYNSTTDVTTVANHRVYDAFGQLKSQTNAAVDCLFGFTGQAFDKDTGLASYRARWYDPAVGRFASEDWLSFAAGDVNLSRYVGNDPVIFTPV